MPARTKFGAANTKQTSGKPEQKQEKERKKNKPNYNHKLQGNRWHRFGIYSFHFVDRTFFEKVFQQGTGCTSLSSLWNLFQCLDTSLIQITRLNQSLQIFFFQQQNLQIFFCHTTDADRTPFEWNKAASPSTVTLHDPDINKYISFAKSPFFSNKYSKFFGLFLNSFWKNKKLI